MEPLAAFSATVLAAALLSVMTTPLSFTLLRLMVNTWVLVLPSELVTLTVMLWLVAAS